MTRRPPDSARPAAVPMDHPHWDGLPTHHPQVTPAHTHEQVAIHQPAKHAHFGVITLILAALISACQPAPPPSATPTTNGDAYIIYMPVIGGNDQPTAQWWQPTPGLNWHIQLQGSLDTTLSVDVVFLDLFDTPTETIAAFTAYNVAVVCYFSAGTFEDWRPDADQFPPEVIGKALPEWEGEAWLDLRRADLLVPIMRARFDLVQQKGCLGLDPDNLDGYLNDSGFDLTGQDTAAYAIWLANEAHSRGLAIGLKNNLPQVAELEPYFDWALNEQCLEYDECDPYTAFITANKPVFNIEYTGEPNIICPQAAALGLDTLFADYELNGPTTPCP